MLMQTSPRDATCHSLKLSQLSPVAETEFCEVERVGMVLSGTATAAMKGKVVELTPGILFYVPPRSAR